MQNIKVDKEFQSLIPPLTAEEFKQLETNLITDGCIDPLVLWGNILIDGHNRYKICTEHNIIFDTVQKEFADRQAVAEWIILHQFGRRNLLPFQRSELALKLKPIIEAKAKANMSAGGGDKKSGMQKSANPIETIQTREELAKLAGVSHDTIEKVSVIKQKATPEQLQRAKGGGKGNSVNAIYHEIKQAELPPDTTKICRDCGKELPLTRFYAGKSICKDCFNHQRSAKDVKGNVITTSPEANKLAAKYSAEIEHDLYDTEKEVEYTANDLVDEIHSLTDYFSRNIKSCVAMHSTLLDEPCNKAKIKAVLSETEAAITKIKELLT